MQFKIGAINVHEYATWGFPLMRENDTLIIMFEFFFFFFLR